jgi:drug/metabolite transporter (DMT)-like permease
VWPVSVVLLHEELSPVRVAGTVLVALGVAAAGLGERSSVATSRVGFGGMVHAGVCAAFVAGYHLAYKVALASGGQPEVVVAISLSLASAVNIATLGRAGAREVLATVRAEKGRIAVAGFLTTLGFIVFLIAMARAGAGLVLTLRNTSILFAQLLAFLLGERVRRLGVVGAVLVTAGAVLLSR